MKKFLIATGVSLLLILAFIFGGYTLSVVWGWFIVPLGVVPISVAHGIGINLVVNFLTYQRDARKKEHKKMPKATELLKMIWNGVLMSLLVLFVGWTVHFFL